MPSQWDSVPRLTYRLYLTDGLPGMLVLAIFVAPEVLPRINDANSDVLMGTIALFALIFAPGLGLVVNTTGYALVEGLLMNLINIIWRRVLFVTYFWRRPERTDIRYELRRILSYAVSSSEHGPERARRLSNLIKKDYPVSDEKDWGIDECVHYARNRVRAIDPEGYAGNERMQGTMILARTLALLSFVVLVSIWWPDLLGGIKWGWPDGTGASHTSAALAFGIASAVLLLVYFAVNDFQTVDIFEKYLHDCAQPACTKVPAGIAAHGFKFTTYFLRIGRRRPQPPGPVP